MEQKILKWQKMVSDSGDETIDVNLRKYVFNKQKDIVAGNPRLQDRNIFIDYFFRNYVEAQILAISRLVEDKPVNSFVALLNDILVNHEEVVRSGKLNEILINKMNKEASDDFIKNHFQKQIENKTSGFSWEKINSDKFDLLKETAKIKLLRDKWVAHRDDKRRQFNIEYDEIGRVIEFIDGKVREYYTFLTDASLPLLPSGIEGDEDIFGFAWFDGKDPDPSTSNL